MRRGLTIYLRLSHGRLEAGPGGGPASLFPQVRRYSADAPP
jgi:hypothetical protein